ncbi:MAG: GHKL domain-containing protein [Bacteriovorax sp.]|nr:GHKL domain-containing protein [Bacteriovorax sp.]
MFLIKKEKSVNVSSDDHDKRERLFFHDIINQTHGLILFLNQRQSINKVISVSEIQMLEKEVRTLQSLIKDHFQFMHKDLTNSYDWVVFNIAEIAIQNLITNYLPKNSVQVFFNKNGIDDKSEVVYFPIFYRIMNNVIKNMSEANGQVIHFNFHHTDNGLIIETKNDVQIEIGDSNTRKGLGLESISSLVHECGGQFEYEFSKGIWSNRIFLPGPKKMTLQEEQKKAA